VFVVHNEGAFGTSARQNNFEKMMDVRADLRFLTANVEYFISTLGWKNLKTIRMGNFTGYTLFFF